MESIFEEEVHFFAFLVYTVQCYFYSPDVSAFMVFGYSAIDIFEYIQIDKNSNRTENELFVCCGYIEMTESKWDKTTNKLKMN